MKVDHLVLEGLVELIGDELGQLKVVELAFSDDVVGVTDLVMGEQELVSLGDDRCMNVES